MRISFVAMFVASAVCVTSASDPDSRLATVRKAFIVAIDELEADRPVAICFSERLSRMTPIESVKAKEEADVIFRIKAHIHNGNVPPFTSTTANIVAELPDGTPLWSEGYQHGTGHGAGIECLLADDLLNTLRDAMKKARDAKK